MRLPNGSLGARENRWATNRSKAGETIPLARAPDAGAKLGSLLKHESRKSPQPLFQ